MAYVKGIEPVLPRPEVKLTDMAFAPAVRVHKDMDLVFLSGMTAWPLDVDPWNPGATTIPDDIEEQSHLMMKNIQSVLDKIGITWGHVVMMVRFSTENRGAGIAREYLGDWRPSSTTIGVTEIGIPGAKVLYDVVAAAPGRS